MKKKQVVFLVLLLMIGFSILFLSVFRETEESKQPGFQSEKVSMVCKKEYGMSFPPFANKKQVDFSVKELGRLGVNKIRIAIDWNNREPKKGEYNWKQMDFRMSAAKENGLSVLLTIPSSGPDWACSELKNEKSCVFKNKDEFRSFIVEVLQRYDLDKVQFGNEWDNTFVGSAQQFVEYNNVLYEATKELSPKTEVVLGGITRAYPITEVYCNRGEELDFTGIEFKKDYSAEKILAEIKKKYCNSDVKKKVLYVLENAKYDTLDIHLYDDPANWQKYLGLLPKEKPIIVTEFGGPSSVFEKTDQRYQAIRMQKYLETIETLPIQEAYYFKLVDSTTSYHKETGLFDGKLQEKKAYRVFETCVDTSASEKVIDD